MQQQEFELLSIHNKLALLFEYGEELYIRNSEGFTIKLYQVEDFFCEIWYSSEANKIYKIQTVDIKEVALLYKIDLDLNDLFND